MTTTDQPPIATPMQHTVRRNGIGLFLLLIGSVPLSHCYWHWLRGDAGPMLATSSQVPWPQWQRASWSDPGRGWMKTVEQHLREDTPVTWELRGRYNELRYRLGILQNPAVLIGKDGWMFMRHSLAPTADLLAQRAARRREIMTAVKRRADTLGVAVVALLVPDKERVYSEFAYGNGAMPPAKAGLYGTILAELRAAGLQAFDAATPLLAAKALRPQELYYHRDTHWTGAGAVAYGQAAAADLENGACAGQLGPTVTYDLPQPTRVEVVGDLLGMCGMRSYVRSNPEQEFSIGLPGSLEVQQLMETAESYGLSVLGAGGARLSPATLREGASIALAGSSFSLENGAAALAFFLRRVVDDRAVHPGASGLRGLREVFERLGAGTARARVVLWEFVERAVLEDDWLTVPAF